MARRVHKLHEGPSFRWIIGRARRAETRSCVAHMQRVPHAKRRSCNPHALNGESRNDPRNTEITVITKLVITAEPRILSPLAPLSCSVLASFSRRPSLPSRVAARDCGIRACVTRWMSFSCSDTGQPLLSRLRYIKRRWLCTVICSSIYLNQSHLNTCPWDVHFTFCELLCHACIYMRASGVACKFSLTRDVSDTLLVIIHDITISHDCYWIWR